MSGAPQRRIALFGGTFDPIHQGHLEIATQAKEAMDLDEVRFLPCRVSPHKIGVASAPPADRLGMARLATRGLPWATVDDFDLVSPPPSYSYLTAAEMTRRFSGARLFWIMGADQWRALPEWKEPQRLAALVEFLVFCRDGHPEARAGFRMRALPGTHPASATAIRRDLAAGLPAADWLDPAVASYIREHHLYKA